MEATRLEETALEGHPDRFEAIDPRPLGDWPLIAWTTDAARDFELAELLLQEGRA